MAEGRAESDWDLARQAARGREDAFAALMRRHEALVRHVVLRRGRDQVRYAGLDELLSETWYQVLRRLLDHADPPAVRFSSWLAGICLNVLKSKQFRAESIGGAGTGGPGLDCDAAPGDAPTPEELAEEGELLAALHACLSKASEVDREVYRLIYVQGLAKTAAARALGCSEANVRQKLLPRLHATLVACLAAHGFTDVDVEGEA
ncbi:MAG: RNA polymerase sigma factor [Planctomycetota bacterium]